MALFVYATLHRRMGMPEGELKEALAELAWECNPRLPEAEALATVHVLGI